MRKVQILDMPQEKHFETYQANKENYFQVHVIGTKKCFGPSPSSITRMVINFRGCPSNICENLKLLNTTYCTGNTVSKATIYPLLFTTELAYYSIRKIVIW